MGWYNGNPSDLNNLPPEMVATRYVKAMGGEAEAIRKAVKRSRTTIIDGLRN